MQDLFSIQTLLTVLPSTITIAAVVVGLIVLQRILERGAQAQTHRFRNQLVMIGVTAFGIFLIILALPLGDSMRGQLLSLIGIVLSAAIALSSTTFLGNAMAGVMMRTVKNFRMGDFIRVEGYFGRVSERGLFHTEIQNEDRELTTLPNLYLVTNPVTTIRSSGTIIAATVSLGYDVPRAKIKDLLLEAAQKAKLDEPFVRVVELGDFSVTYRIAGLLQDTKKLVSTRSRLRGLVMDELHLAGIEIVSPNFMNTRALNPDQSVIPHATVELPHDHEGVAADELVFDKADDAESLETLKDLCDDQKRRMGELEEKIKSSEGEERTAAEAELGRRRRHLARLEKLLSAREDRVVGDTEA